ncbi:hypothetical protein SAMN05444354_12277 [Stigmatella aurantiaca]|uniref:Uncharacterized protein n=2 Tax=Stigmatella aurantiaca TaxID=41 RepID=A0A1H8AW41_STIAU|nr:hypothetical protein SAMN05444354_12277 [Stigmatella aurantiaca]
MGEILTALAGWMAQEEWRLLIERTNAGLTLACCMGTKSGKPIGRSPADLLNLGIGERAVMKEKSIRTAAREVGIAEFVLLLRLLSLGAQHVGRSLAVSATAAKARVGEEALQRHVAALTASQGVEGGGTHLLAASAP